MYKTFTKSVTSTYTAARARYVVGKVHDDFIAMETRGILSRTTYEYWKEIILWFMEKKALIFFEIQFSVNGQKKCALKYTLQDGNCSSDDNSGGIDYWDLPKYTDVSILINWDRGSSFINEIEEKVKDWEVGQSLQADTFSQGNVYSKDNYGLSQEKIGW